MEHCLVMQLHSTLLHRVNDSVRRSSCRHYKRRQQFMAGSGRRDVELFLSDVCSSSDSDRSDNTKLVGHRRPISFVLRCGWRAFRHAGLGLVRSTRVKRTARRQAGRQALGSSADLRWWSALFVFIDDEARSSHTAIIVPLSSVPSFDI